MWLLAGVLGKDSLGIHDWNNILSRTNLLEYDHALAIKIMVVAIALVGVSFCWGRRRVASHA